MPDSLKKEFRTRLGRKVYDGGGITPDITVEPQYYSRPVISLIYSNVLSDYALRYFNTHDSIAPAGVFSLTEEEYEDFVKFASQKEFDARTESRIEMEIRLAEGIRCPYRVPDRDGGGPEGRRAGDAGGKH